MANSFVNVALDAMGGDNAPGEIVKGAIDAVNSTDKVKIFFVGIPEVIQKELSQYTYPAEQVEIVAASEIIETGEPPVNAIRTKKDSSIVVGIRMVRDGAADAFLSSGSTGAVLVGAQALVGRIKGVMRTPLAPFIPTVNGASLLIDCGANVDARAEHLVQFAKMGSVYMKNAMGIENPRVAIVNIGAEEEKGNALVKETFPLLKECKDINFIGNIEARDIPTGAADVIVCEAFVGNVILKLYEGTGSALLGQIKGTLMSSLKTKIGALFIKSDLKKTLTKFDPSEYGAAPMLGMKGLVAKMHGSAKAKEVKIAITQCITFKEQNIPEKIRVCIQSDESSENSTNE